MSVSEPASETDLVFNRRTSCDVRLFVLGKIPGGRDGWGGKHRLLRSRADIGFVRCGYARSVRNIPLHAHVQVVFVAQCCYFRHEGRGVMPVERMLVFPAVNQKDGFRVVHREEVFVPDIPSFRTDLLNRPARAAVINIDGNCHCFPRAVRLAAPLVLLSVALFCRLSSFLCGKSREGSWSGRVLDKKLSCS